MIRMIGVFALVCAACAESKPGLYVRGPSSNWFGKDSAIEGQIETNQGHEIAVTVIVTSETDSARSEQEIPSTDTPHRIGQHVRMTFFEDGSVRFGFSLGGLVRGESFGTWCAADEQAALITLKLHDLLLVDSVYKMEGDVMRFETEDTGTLRLRHVGP